MGFERKPSFSPRRKTRGAHDPSCFTPGVLRQEDIQPQGTSLPLAQSPLPPQWPHWFCSQPPLRPQQKCHTTASTPSPGTPTTFRYCLALDNGFKLAWNVQSWGASSSLSGCLLPRSSGRAVRMGRLGREPAGLHAGSQSLIGYSSPGASPGVRLYTLTSQLSLSRSPPPARRCCLSPRFNGRRVS